MRLLLVEDDRRLGEILHKSITRGGHAIDWVKSARSALTVFDPETHEVILLDLSLPDGDGMDVVKQIRENKAETPIIIISSRDSVDEKVQGLNTGADDYLTKPISAREILAKLRVVQRRICGRATQIVTNGKIFLNLGTREAWLDNEKHKALTPKEFAILSALIQNSGRILSRAELEAIVYNLKDSVDSNSIDFLIHKLRNKIGFDSIRNVRGAGWIVDNY